MARYKADIQGNRGRASRLGSKTSGIWGHIRGWDIGVEVFVEPDEDNQSEDMATVYLTHGSNGGRSVCIGVFKLSDFGSEGL